MLKHSCTFFLALILFHVIQIASIGKPCIDISGDWSGPCKDTTIEAPLVTTVTISQNICDVKYNALDYTDDKFILRSAPPPGRGHKSTYAFWETPSTFKAFTTLLTKTGKGQMIHWAYQLILSRENDTLNLTSQYFAEHPRKLTCVLKKTSSPHVE